jgi:hypothetical protein
MLSDIRPGETVRWQLAAINSWLQRSEPIAVPVWLSCHAANAAADIGHKV